MDLRGTAQENHSVRGPKWKPSKIKLTAAATGTAIPTTTTDSKNNNNLLKIEKFLKISLLNRAGLQKKA